MADNLSGPLGAALFRTLTDKLYEKRKAGALEVEKIVREQLANNQNDQMENVLNFLAELAVSTNPNYRKGGLIGLAAFAIAAGKNASNYTGRLVLPVLESFHDPDSRIRYYACEALYNIIKITRESTLSHFNILFDTLARCACDQEQNVRSGADLLDRSLKDIVTGAQQFRIEDFIAELRDKIYTKNSATRRFLISWIQVINSTPQFDIVRWLPEILDGCFHILSDETERTRNASENVLGEFLRKIKQKPSDADLQHMVNVLIVHAQSSDNLVQLIALIWLRDFLFLGGSSMLRFSSGYLTAILPCLSFEDEPRKNIRETAANVNQLLMKLIDEEKEHSDVNLDLQSVALVLQENLQHNLVPTRVAVLRWIHHLYKKLPAKTFPYIQEVFPLLLQLLPDSSDEVVLLDLEVLADVCCSNRQKIDQNILVDENTKLWMSSLKFQVQENFKLVSPYFVKLVMSLLNVFRKDVKLLAERGAFIIRQLCILLNADEVYQALAILLIDEDDVQFASQMVQTLNVILLTSPELFQLRTQLKDFRDEKYVNLFKCLYQCWSHQPVALLSLCLLTRNYEHSANLIQYFSELEMTVELLAEIDKLIQLIESPIFTYLRLQLLNVNHQRHLTIVLYGLLMLLPQTEAFHTLHRRLQCLPAPAVQSESNGIAQNGTGNDWLEKIDFHPLFEHFKKVQERHKQFRRTKMKELIR